MAGLLSYVPFALLAVTRAFFFAITTVLFRRQIPGSYLVCSQSTVFLLIPAGVLSRGEGGSVVSGREAGTRWPGGAAGGLSVVPWPGLPLPRSPLVLVFEWRREQPLKTCPASPASCPARSDLPGLQLSGSSCSAFSSGLVTAPVQALVTLP